jgi:hypothetical protein
VSKWYPKPVAIEAVRFEELTQDANGDWHIVVEGEVAPPWLLAHMAPGGLLTVIGGRLFMAPKSLRMPINPGNWIMLGAGGVIYPAPFDFPTGYISADEP